MDIGISVEHPTKTIDTVWFANVLQSALPHCIAASGAHPCRQVLGDLEELSVALVDDESIAKIHEEFMNVAGATDVITFDHGEIIISLDTAAFHAEEFGCTFEDEVARYGVHGLLHLIGHCDHEPVERDTMHEIQETILELALAGVASLDHDGVQ